MRTRTKVNDSCARKANTKTAPVTRRTKAAVTKVNAGLIKKNKKTRDLGKSFTNAKATAKGFVKHVMKPNRFLCENNDAIDVDARIAEGVYLSMATRKTDKFDTTNTAPPTHIVEKIDVIHNKKLRKEFEATKRKFAAAEKDSKEVFMFHGTPPHNVNPIITNNFNLNKGKRFLYGKGFYMSEHPFVSHMYGTGIMVDSASGFID
jgi:hypothetical protein